jgi:hypothetical protein
MVKCAACRKEKPVHAMKTCMHHQMHRYVCDAKCMDDFYNPFKKPASEIDQLRADNQRLREALTVIAKTGYGHGGELAEITAKAALTTANGEVIE